MPNWCNTVISFFPKELSNNAYEMITKFHNDIIASEGYIPYNSNNEYWICYLEAYLLNVPFDGYKEFSDKSGGVPISKRGYVYSMEDENFEETHEFTMRIDDAWLLI